MSKVEGRPTFEIIKEIDKSIATNAEACESKLGGGLYRRLCVTMPPSRRLTISGDSFTPYFIPRALPSFPHAPTQSQIAQISATRKMQLRL